MEENLKILGSLEDEQKISIAEEFIQAFLDRYPNIVGELYLGYPIYVDEVANRKISVDMALITKIGVYIFNILTTPVTDYGVIQDDIYAKVEAKFKKQNFLFKRKKLIFDFETITYTTVKIQEMEDYPLVTSISDTVKYIEDTALEKEFSDELYSKILSGLQEAYGINTHRDRGIVEEGTKAYAINQMTSLIERYDSRQMEAILSDTVGIQRIRGMAGSGKTIVLARKAVELHTAHPDWEIVVTYSTRSLKNQLISLIQKFYAAKNDGARYNENKLKVMHAWGSSTSRGVYYDVCLCHGISPLNFGEARAKYGSNANHFSKVCEDLLKGIKTFNKMYDCVLIDEAQDFDKNFLQLCLKVLDKNQRLVYAYDELQKLNEDAMPQPEEIFGQGIQNDTPLTVCYRNQGNAIVTAHAMGMGLYSEEGLLQLPGSSTVWESIGYVSDKPIKEGEEVTLYRTKETSPELLKVEPEEIIKFLGYNDSFTMYAVLIEMLRNDLNKEKLVPRDIMIIDMDAIEHVNHKDRLVSMLMMDENFNWSKEDTFLIHSAGSTVPEDFFRDDSVVYSSIYRAKGNEAFMVYIVNAQKCINSLMPRSDRNALFTAITRSKGWVRVMGYGEEMTQLCEEFETIKDYDYKLHFVKYPTDEEKKQLILNNKDVDANIMSSISKTRALISKVKSEAKVSNLQLMMEVLGISTKEELMKMLLDNEEE